MRPGNWLQSLNCAVEGVLLAAKTQRNLRAHILAAMAVLLAAYGLGIPPVELALLVLAIGFVLAAEVLNSAVEQVVDLLSPDWHEKARAAKDMAAGAVLVSISAAVAVGAVVFYPRAMKSVVSSLTAAAAASMGLTLLVLGVVLAATVLLKVRWRRGTPLHGGMPSGHSAVAFAVWTLLSLLTRNPLVVLLVLLLAVMVSHSRTLMGIHSLAEVTVGALLGSTIALLLYQVFSRMAGG